MQYRRPLRGAGLALAATIVVLAAAPTADAQPREAQARVMARRGATVDGYRQLLERVKGLQLDSQTYVRDFVTESDVIETDLSDFIRGASIVDTRYYDDGTCEVDVEVTVESLEQEITRIIRERWTLRGWKKQPPEVHIHQYYTQKTIMATGSSALHADEPEPMAPIAAPAPPMTRSRGYMHPDWASVSGQQKLMAKRGAQVDAYRQLLERVKGLRLDSQTYVRDFVTESDIIETQLSDWIRGARVIDTRYVAGPICEVEVEVDVQDLEREFQRIVQQHGRHQHVTIRITDYYSQRTLTAIGNAVPGGGAAPVAVVPAAPVVPAWVSQGIVATGYGVAPADAETPAQGRLLAERAAELDAKRQLLERIGGVQVSSSTSVRDFITQYDEIRTGVDGIIRGAHRVDTRYNDDGTVEVDVEAPLDEVWALVRVRL